MLAGFLYIRSAGLAIVQLNLEKLLLRWLKVGRWREGERESGLIESPRKRGNKCKKINFNPGKETLSMQFERNSSNIFLLWVILYSCKLKIPEKIATRKNISRFYHEELH